MSGAVIGLWPPRPLSLEGAAAAACRTVRAVELPLSPPLAELDSMEVADATLRSAEARLAKLADVAVESGSTDGVTSDELGLATALVEQARRNQRKVADWRSGAVKVSVWVCVASARALRWRCAPCAAMALCCAPLAQNPMVHPAMHRHALCARSRPTAGKWGNCSSWRFLESQCAHQNPHAL
eukprot:SAG11_NODE_416_length_9669_cov_7.135528_2_plen_183_part_00